MSSARGASRPARRAAPAHASLAAWPAMLHSLGDPAWIVDAGTLVLAGVNQAAKTLLGLNELALQDRFS